MTLLGEAEMSVMLEMAKQVPSLVVLGWIVTYFLKALALRDQAVAMAAKETAAVIERNSAALGAVQETLDNHRQTIADAVRDALRERTKDIEDQAAVLRHLRDLLHTKNEELQALQSKADLAG